MQCCETLVAAIGVDGPEPDWMQPFADALALQGLDKALQSRTSWPTSTERILEESDELRPLEAALATASLEIETHRQRQSEALKQKTVSGRGAAMGRRLRRPAWH